MATSTAPSRHPIGLGALTRCPACGGELSAVSDGEATNFLCEPCLRCWHVELGYVYRVDPATCSGCSRRSECLAPRGAD